ERQIAYSTFTIVDMDRKGETRIVEYDNPPFLLIREGEAVSLPHQEMRLPTAMGRDAVIREARFSALPGDRIVVCSDGVTQAGVGQRGTPLGWGSEAEADFLRGILKERPDISARQLARALVHKALSLDGHKAKDDISCGVIYLRKPREVLVFTGASVDRAMDKEMARIALAFEGRKVICGGTTAGILSRELGRPLEMDLRELDPDVPPVSTLEGFDLVTEGAITLAAVARMLDEQDAPELERPNAATRLAGVLLDGDIIHIVAGTKINEALQDPNLPQDLDIRRNLLRRLHRVLTEKFLKEVKIRFI
ncbi:MAG: SpoIIE family protein phosphatase, partial [Thermoanaerobaculia bacterium]|nr:SpoIIE family protein phosphatase [Thermoanaerobaculia bacterium]